MLHGPKIRDADNAVQLLSEGFFNLSQQYKFVWASIYNHDLDKEPKFKDLECSSCSFCWDYIGPFMNSLAVLSSLRTSGAWNEDDVKTNNPYPTSAKEYFLNFLNQRAPLLHTLLVL